ncbi:MAG: VOC family protein [Rhizobium sp.]|nr:VOC family protein [Rhizobium sp.]
MTADGLEISAATLGYDPRRLFHLGYVVPNMDRSVKAWIRMGAQILVPPSIDATQQVNCALLVFKGAVPIELVAPLDAIDSPVRNRLARGGGLDHTCIFSDDVAGDLSALVEEGASIAVAPCYGSVFDREIAFAVTRVGLVVELMSRQRAGLAKIDPLAGAASLWGF